MLEHRQWNERTDQAHHLRRLVEGYERQKHAPTTNTRVIAVASGKGGVGKTQIAVNLSIALAARNYRVMLLDMDFGLANADILLGVENNGGWAEMLAGRRELQDVVLHGPGNIAFMPGASGITGMANLSEFERHRLLSAIREIEDQYDVVVLDCGAGISENVTSFALAADLITVVATPEPTAVTDAYATIKALALNREYSGRPGGSSSSIGVIVNQAESRREARETYERLAGVAARFLGFPVNDYGYILRDEHVPAAVRQRYPLILQYPRCSASACLVAAASRLAGEMGQPQASPGLFYRVMNMFL